ncbi:hypothetical protein SLS62_004906 [Diatrype stigma]|uniref:Ornithine cyclodeaminase n=1 Tax=Diatrype stigma TaxID=117547 RepID=A0AAN9V467_9PEZI
MSLAILTDDQIRALLESLSHEEAETLLHKLRRALHDYSTGQQHIDAGLVHQPERTVIHSEVTGRRTLFMPSVNVDGHAVKVVTLPGPDADPSLPAAKPTGSMTLYGSNGSPIGFLHAKTLTAFRTALASACLLERRKTVRTLTVFGSGLQAYWHIRLALMLRGHTIRRVHIINRRFSENAKDILKKFHAVPQSVKEREGWESARFGLLTPGYGDYHRLLTEYLVSADVIFCCTPSTEDLFSAETLTDHHARLKGRLIVAVGSYTPQMHELPRELLLQATKSPGGGRHYHKHAIEGGVVVVDTLDGAMKEAGEIIDAGLQPTQLVELGELIMLRKLQQEGESPALTPAAESPVTESFDKLDISSGNSAMATALGASSSELGVGNTNDSRYSSSHNSRRSMSRSPGRLPRNGSGTSVRDFFHRRTASSQNSSASALAAADKDKEKEREKERDREREDREKEKEKREDHLVRWIRSGNVIYKGVGLGLMDLVVGLEVVRLAQQKGFGSVVENFSSSPTSP